MFPDFHETRSPPDDEIRRDGDGEYGTDPGVVSWDD